MKGWVIILIISFVLIAFIYFFFFNHPPTSIQLPIANEIINPIFSIKSIGNSSLNITEENLTANLSVTTTQFIAIIGEPVRWLKTVEVSNASENITIEIPKQAESISIKTGEEIEQALSENSIALAKKGIPAEKVKGVQENAFSSSITESENSKIVDVASIARDTGQNKIGIEYYTEAPQSVEENISGGKRIIVSGPDELNYTDILAYTEIPETSQEKIKLYHLTSQQENITDENNETITQTQEIRELVNMTYYDNNNNSLIDYVEWNVPHLSNQTYELIIEISKAEHLDSNRNFISDIYEQVKVQDNNWTSIPDGDYVRVTFNRNLTSDRDITIYARSNSSAGVEVYEFNQENLIATFPVIDSEKYYKIYLTNLTSESQDVFDLKSIGSVDYDYIVDPGGANNLSACGNITIGNIYYTLNQSVTSVATCFNVTANNVTIDCQGFLINYSTAGASGIGYGISVVQANFTTIKNCIITEGNSAGSNKHAILFYTSNNGTISNNTINTLGTSVSQGIRFDSTSNCNNISSNTITTTGGTGIGIHITSNSRTNTIDSNIISTSGNAAFGIMLYFTSSGNVLTNNKVNTSLAPSYMIYATNSYECNNSISSSNWAEGKAVNYTSNANNLVFNGVDFTAYGEVIFCNSKNITILNSNFSNDGLNLFNTTNSLIANNNFTTNTSYGINVYLSSSSNNIMNNSIVTTGARGYGIFNYFSNLNNINNNTIITSGSSAAGIYNQYSSNYNTISNNRITTSGSGAHGIRFEGQCNSNVMVNDTITCIAGDANGIHLYINNDNNSFSGMNVRTTSVATGANAFYIQDTNHNFTIRDSILNASKPGLTEFNATSAVTGGNWTFINVTRADGSSPITTRLTAGANGTLNMMWYLDAYSNYSTNGTAAVGVNVTAWNVNNNLLFSGLTGADGRIAKQTVLEFMQNGTGYAYFSNYTINASLTGYVINSQSWNMSANRDLVFTMSSSDTTPSYFTLIPNGQVINYTDNFGVQFNATDETAFGFFAVNDTTLFNINQSGWLKNMTLLPVGAYYLNISINDTLNNVNSTIYNLNVSQLVANVTAYINNTHGNFSADNRTRNILLNGTRISGEGDIELWLNGTKINTGTSPLSNYTNFTISGWFNFSAVYPATQNYSLFVDTHWINYTKYVYVDTVQPSFSLIPNGQVINYTDNFGVRFTGIDEYSFGYYDINQTDLFNINQSGWLKNTSILGVGNYYINVTINDTSNNINSTIYNLNVSQLVANVTNYINNTIGNFTADNRSINIPLNGSRLIGEGIIELWVNGTKINIGASPLSNMTNFTIEGRNMSGSFNFSVIYPSSQNYSKYIRTYWINISLYTVTDTTPPYFVTIPPSPNLNITNSSYLLVWFNATDEIAFDTYAVNDTTNFNINATGWLRNITALVVGNYYLNISINDTSNNGNSTVWNFNVSEYLPDTTSPVFTNCRNFTVYNNSAFAGNISATDDIAMGSYILNDTTNFYHPSHFDGMILNNTPLYGILGYHHLNLTVNDSFNNLAVCFFYINVKEYVAPGAMIKILSISPSVNDTVPHVVLRRWLKFK